MATIGSLVADLTIRTASFIAGLNNSADAMNRTARQMEQQTALIQKGFGVAGTAAKAFAVGLAGAIGAQTLSGFARLAKGALDAADNLAETSKRVGVTVEQLQGLQFAAEQTGGSTGKMTDALDQFNKRIGQAAESNTALAKILAEQGIALTNSEGKIRSTNELLFEYAEVIEGAGSAQEKARLVQEGFGRSAAELINLFSEGAAGIQAYVAESERLGQISTANAEASDRANDSLNRASQAFTAARDSILVGAAPALEKFAELMVRLIEGFQSLDPNLQAIIGGFTAFVAAATPLAALLAPIALAIGTLSAPILLVVGGLVGAAGLVAAIIAFREEIGGAVLGAIDSFKNAFSGVGTVLETVAGWFSSAKEAMDLGGTIGAIEKDMKRLEPVMSAPARAASLKVSAHFKKLQEDVVGNSYVPDMIDGIESEFKRLGRVMVAPAAAATAAVDARFSDLYHNINDEELLRRTGQATAGGLSAPGASAGSGLGAEQQADLMAEPFKNALRDIQSSFTDTFRTIFEGGVTSFSDIADQAEKIFIDLAANLATTAIFNPQSIAGLFGAPGGAPGAPGAPGAQQGLGLLGGALGAGALGFAGGTAAGGFFGGQGQLGGGIGGGLGAAAGFALTGGNPLGGLVGGLLGGVGGGFLGGLFGGGGDKDKFSGTVQGGLGSAGGAGIGDAIKSFDAAISQLLTTRQRDAVNAALRKASGTSFSFKGDLDQGTIEHLTGERARDIARGLGFRAQGIAPGAISAQQATANIQTALQTRRAIEDLTNKFSVFDRQVGELDTQFRELRDNARRFGISLSGLAEAQAKAAEDLRKAQDAQLKALLDPFEALSGPLEAFQKQLEFSGLGPAEQFARAQEEFDRISGLAEGGDLAALGQLQSAGEALIGLAERFGASPGGAAARDDVAEAVTTALDRIEAAREKAENSVKDEVERHRRDEIQRLDQLIESVEKVAVEIRRSGRKVGA